MCFKYVSRAGAVLQLRENIGHTCKTDTYVMCNYLGLVLYYCIVHENIGHKTDTYVICMYLGLVLYCSA